MIVDFLKSGRSKDDLKIALQVLREFKECESQDEWLSIQFTAWAKLEQLEEFLAHMVDGEALAEDTIRELTKASVNNPKK